MKNIFFIIICLLLISSVYATEDNDNTYPCQAIIWNNSCWINKYTVNISLINATTQKVLASTVLKKGSKKVIMKYKCPPNIPIKYVAKFYPIIWEEDKNKEYFSTQTWRTPPSLPKDSLHWEVEFCWPDHFLSVPMPLGKLENCHCYKPKEEDSKHAKDKKK